MNYEDDDNASVRAVQDAIAWGIGVIVMRHVGGNIIIEHVEPSEYSQFAAVLQQQVGEIKKGLQ